MERIVIDYFGLCWFIDVGELFICDDGKLYSTQDKRTWYCVKGFLSTSGAIMPIRT